MKRILLLGAEGQVGQELRHTLTGLGEVLAVGRSGLDLSDPHGIKPWLESVQPDVIVNAAAYTAVDQAEQEPELAKTINGVVPTQLAEWAQECGATLVHLSTDYVFDGTQRCPYREADPTQPLNLYGESKLQGEEGIRQHCARHLIVRTAWLYGVHGKNNFVKTMLRLGAERPEVRVVKDQIGTPTWAGDLARAIASLLEQFQPELAGIYHFTNSGVASWYDFALAIFSQARRLGFPLQVEQVLPISSTEYPTPAQRPAYSVLNTDKITALLGGPPPPWTESLQRMLTDLYQAIDQP